MDGCDQRNVVVVAVLYRPMHQCVTFAVSADVTTGLPTASVPLQMLQQQPSDGARTDVRKMHQQQYYIRPTLRTINTELHMYHRRRNFNEACAVHYTVSKNTPTLANCSFDKIGLILIIFGKQHQHTFRNDIHIQLYLSLQCYLLYLLLSSCDGNDARVLMKLCARKTVQFLQQVTPDFISPDLCPPNSLDLNPVDYRIWGLMVMQECVYIVEYTSPRHQQLEAAPHWHIGKCITKSVSRGESGYVQAWRRLAKGHCFEHILNWNLFRATKSTEENTLFRLISVAAI